MRIELEFAENGVISTLKVPQEGKNAEFRQVFVFTSKSELIDWISAKFVEKSEKRA